MRGHSHTYAAMQQVRMPSETPEPFVVASGQIKPKVHTNTKITQAILVIDKLRRALPFLHEVATKHETRVDMSRIEILY